MADDYYSALRTGRPGPHVLKRGRTAKPAEDTERAVRIDNDHYEDTCYFCTDTPCPSYCSRYNDNRTAYDDFNLYPRDDNDD